MFHLCIHDSNFLIGASSMIIARAEDVNWDELLGASEGASKWSYGAGRVSPENPTEENADCLTDLFAEKYLD